MIIPGDRFGQTAEPHELERDAVGQAETALIRRPAAEGSQRVQSPIYLLDLANGNQDFVELLQRLHAQAMLNQRPCLVEYVAGGLQPPAFPLRTLETVAGSEMEGIVAIQQRVEPGTVDEYLLHGDSTGRASRPCWTGSPRRTAGSCRR